MSDDHQKTTEADGPQVKQCDFTMYLNQIYNASKKLTVPEEADDDDIKMDIDEDCNDSSGLKLSPDDWIDQIAKTLLQACFPETLALGVSHLPKLNIFDFDEVLDTVEDDESEIHYHPPYYEHRRTDYLRRLLRLMAPISMEVCVTVLSMVVSNDKALSTGVAGSTQKQLHSRATQFASILMLSHWLPVAPHLMPMAIEFFRLLENPWQRFISENQLEDDRICLVVAESLHQLCVFFRNSREMQCIKNLNWDWSFVFRMLHADTDTSMSDNSSRDHETFEPRAAIRWYAVRILSLLMDWTDAITAVVVEKWNLGNDDVSWRIHPWEFDQEEIVTERTFFTRQATLWDDPDIHITIPSTIETHALLRPSPYLARIGEGISFFRDGYLKKKIATMTETFIDLDSEASRSVNLAVPSRSLVPTPATQRNLALLGAAMCQNPHPPPILICGPLGSGKSSLVREFLRICRPAETLMEFHIDEETDSKTLIGSYTTTDIPGDFIWRPGSLTHASREGRWILIEDIDVVPVEIQAALVKLIEDRRLPIGNGKYERCHPSFQIFATCTTTEEVGERGSLRIKCRRGGGKLILNPSYWRKIHVKSMPSSELREVAISLFPTLPSSVIDSSLLVFRALDQSGQSVTLLENSQESGEHQDVLQVLNQWNGGRTRSVRDLFKLLSRITNGICFEKGTSFMTEAQRTICMAECIDVFAGSCPDPGMKDEFIRFVAAPSWNIAPDQALKYCSDRCPTLVESMSHVEIGRVMIDIPRSVGVGSKSLTVFAQTNHSLRLMESLASCVRGNEPILLVGETGGGKTSLIQHLARHCKRTLIVQNLSLQTDSTDLLGGYRPLEIKNVARQVYNDFVDTFVSTFSRKQNEKFLQYAASMMEKSNWKTLSQCFQKASKLGLERLDQRHKNDKDSLYGAKLDAWESFAKKSERFERQRVSCDIGLAFEFVEGALVDAVRSGKWVLLDEINLASSETLQRLCGLLDDPKGSLTLLERGDANPIPRHPSFRLFAAMNPATDAGKKDLPTSIRSRFSELYVEELNDPIELRVVAASYLSGVLPSEGKSSEHTDIVVSVVSLYLKCRALAETSLSDGNGQKPRYTMRTLSRALCATKMLVLTQRIPLKRAIFEGFQLAFEGTLNPNSKMMMTKLLTKSLLNGLDKTDLNRPGRRPGQRGDSGNYVLVKPFWINAGPLQPTDWSEVGQDGISRFILTPSVLTNLRRLSCTLAAGPWPILLEGPTSSGKTTIVEYMGARCGHRVVRINNHEHTDVQEYTGTFASDRNGLLSFRDGILVQALRRGHWVILDELNLAPSEVLEALNRLLDDNRELYLAETNETIKPHPNFRLFATQNPSGIYGGRKPLSRAFRNRFVELHFDDIPSEEMTTILEKRCGCPPSHAKLLVKIMLDLQHRRSTKSVFLGKDSFITPRDLLRWAERHSTSKQELAEHGYMLLAERLRSEEEKCMVKDVLEEHLKVTIDLESLYFGDHSETKKLLEMAIRDGVDQGNQLVSSIAPTRSLLRLVHLVLNCIKKKEPVLLVGETGCGKTLVVQLLSFVLGRNLFSVNCHATTETSDLIGGLRPVRGRESIKQQMVLKLRELLKKFPVLEDAIPSAESDRYLQFDCNVDCLDKFDIDTMLEVTRALVTSHWKDPVESDTFEKQLLKRRKLQENDSPGRSHDITARGQDLFQKIVSEIEDLGRRSKALFEWYDGPLVKAMKEGQLILLDEMSLAEDAVLERLNSVLEPSRVLVLAEKGESGSLDSTQEDDRVIHAHDDFRCFATMNPGGDFGKRELSPALRSRFTEIWVPSVGDREDFEIVVNRYLSLNLGQERILELPLLVNRMLNYIEWFNGFICGDPSSPLTGHELSLRDVLSWTRFIVESQKSGNDLQLWNAYYHGACLMHLDGLGLGSGLSPETSMDVKEAAKKYLLDAIGDQNVSNQHGVDRPFCVQSGKFGAFPYFIPIGNIAVSGSIFDMSAPTTSLNVFRILRAMQVRKPILLEGAPGVGKTSLVSALAAATGHKLVRINLSEQTDISDLMGNDLPVESSSTCGPSFEWRDGVLLTALKEGSWVLLDELNLASQAVLEGLNSCLDHRGAVFIPELGKSFECPSTFRVFGAQNPLGQGGGRKGLPKSFLNRFTKVFVDPLSDHDFQSILFSRFGSLSSDCVRKIIDFNCQVHKDVVEMREYGSDGGPWEFNLRDIFRWSELLKTGTLNEMEAARDLYYQRFRHSYDRDRVDRTFQQYFGTSMAPSDPPLVTISTTSAMIGKIQLARLDPARVECRSNGGQGGSSVLFSNLLPMQAIACCVSMRWPCLLIGGSMTGKSSILSSLAQICNATLVEQSLSPSSDVTELLGAFEQVESDCEENQIVDAACMLADEISRVESFVSPNSHLCWSLARQLEVSVNARPKISNASEFPSRLSLAHQLSTLLVQMIGNNPILECFRERISALQLRIKSTLDNNIMQQLGNSGHFVWRDGVLVEAMLKGHWLVLENVNLCPASVLDRLNSVTEPNGTLLLSESGALQDDGNQSHRLITPHPNFRIFLTMNPSHGEISRAMRNRCVEISLVENALGTLPNGSRELRMMDMLGQLRGVGVRTLDTASKLIEIYSEEQALSLEKIQEPPNVQSFLDSGRLMSASLSRGTDCFTLSRLLLQVTYEWNEEEGLKSFELSRALCDVRPTIPLPEHQGVIPMIAGQDFWDRRLLRSFSSRNTEDKMAVRLFTEIGLLGPLEDDETNPNVPFSGSICRFGKLSSHATQEFLYPRMRNAIDLPNLSMIRVKNKMSSMALWMGSNLRRGPSKGDSCYIMGGDPRLVVALSIASRRFEEKSFRKALLLEKTLPQLTNKMSVLQVSFYINAGLLDGSKVHCTVSRSIHSFFVALDEWIDDLVETGILQKNESSTASLDCLLAERNSFWDLLRGLPFDLNAEGPTAFQSCEFIVQWKWLRKKMLLVAQSDVPRALTILTTAIDTGIFGDALYRKFLSKVGKRTMAPITPKSSSQWQSSMFLDEIAKRISVFDDCGLGPFGKKCQTVSLHALVINKHPCLFVSVTEKINLLAALATLQISWWDNVEGVGWIDGIDFQKTISDSFEKSKDRFAVELARVKIDKDIQTVDNQVEATILKDLSSLSDTSISNLNAFGKLKARLFEIFGTLQISPLVEYWCAWKEDAICEHLCKAQLGSTDDESIQSQLVALVPQLKELIDTGVSMTSWAVSDFRAYQLLLWMATGTSSTRQVSLRDMIRSLMPIIQAVRLRHLFSGAMQGNAVSPALEMPDMCTDDKSTDPWPLHSEGAIPERTFVGSSGLWQSMRSEFMLDFVGKQLSYLNHRTAAKHYTIENAKFREDQSVTILNFLSHAVTPSRGRLYSFHFILSDILTAATAAFKTVEMDGIIESLADPQKWTASRIEDILDAGDKVSNALFDALWLDVLRPLLRSLWLAWKSEVSSREYIRLCSLTSIYLGLLRLNVLAPSSPLDPGRAPLAKVSLITAKINSLQTKLAAKQLHSWFVHGSYAPGKGGSTIMEENETSFRKRRNILKKKIIERAKGVPPYHALVTEINEFLTNASPTKTITQLIQMSQNVEQFSQSFQPWVLNWMSTSNGFCERLSKDFLGYEDVTTSVVEAIGMMQDGFLGLATDKSTSEDLGHCYHALCNFPMCLKKDSIQHLHMSMEHLFKDSSGFQQVDASSSCCTSMALAVFARLSLKKVVMGLDHGEIYTCFAMVNKMLGLCPDTETRVSSAQTPSLTIEEAEEIAFREQFPNHKTDFELALKAEDDGNDLSNDEESEVDCEREGTPKLSDRQMDLLFHLFTCLFRDDSKVEADNSRKLAFHLAYAAAYELLKVSRHDCRISMIDEPLGGHVFALSLTSIPKTRKTKMYQYLHDNGELSDFQSEPCPSMALEASRPLDHLIARTTQLLTAFPGHSVLLGLLKVCEKVVKLNLITTPMGKVMTGMEFILRQAQDWEQHASEKVKIGMSLVEIAKLVSDWRKLELESWGKLLEARRMRYIKKARKHWNRLHSILLFDNEEEILPKSNDTSDRDEFLTPPWVWKGIEKVGARLSSTLCDVQTMEVKELLKVLDTFMLTSPLGEFQERLAILRGSSIEILERYKLSRTTTSWRLQQARLLLSVWNYYNQYTEFLEERMDKLTRPIKDKLKNETKLAKWDIQSYYALADSTERNQRKLMKVLSEFDEVLDLNVGVLVQQESCAGLRASVDNHDESCSTFPSLSSIFPFELVRHEETPRVSGKTSEPPSTYYSVLLDDQNWLAFFPRYETNRLGKIGQYAKKMEKWKGNHGKSLAFVGSDETSTLCQGIFDRIEALRIKSNRPMKERALVDLFRALQQNDFKTTKWSTPGELRCMEQIFLLPMPELFRGGTSFANLSKTEEYFRKCIAEVHALSSETTIIGSKYITKRQIELMVNVSYSGVFMATQQRCVLCKVANDAANLQDLVVSLPSPEQSPTLDQSVLKGRVNFFDTELELAREGLNQLGVLFRSVIGMIEEDKEKEHARHIYAKIESAIKGMPQRRKKEFFVTKRTLEQIRKDSDSLATIGGIIEGCRNECKNGQFLPAHTFDDVVRYLRISAKTGLECVEENCGSSMLLDTHAKDENCYEFLDALSLIVQRILITYQNLKSFFEQTVVDPTSEPIIDSEQSLDAHRSIGDLHKQYIRLLAAVDLKKIRLLFSNVLESLTVLCDDRTISVERLEFCWAQVSNTRVLLSYLLDLCREVLGDSILFHRSMSKLNYVITRVFRTLVAKGYCSDQAVDGDDEGGGDVNAMTFEDDNDGTGMGEGEGKKDVTDQIENEDQLSGLKGDKEEKSAENPESKQLNEEEADQGMEMEADFDGEMYDMPDQPKDDQGNEDNNDDKEELEREMGDDGNVDDQVVDEKLWDDRDDDDPRETEEKFEQDAAVEGEAIEDAIRTKEDEQDQSSPTGAQPKSSKEDNHQTDDTKEDGGESENNDDHHAINDDLEELYEDDHGVDVRGEGKEDDQNDEVDEEMQLAEELNLDNDKSEDCDSQTESDNEAPIGNDGEEGKDEESTNEMANDDDKNDEEMAEDREAHTAEGEKDLENREDEQEQDVPENAISSPEMKRSQVEAHGIKSTEGADGMAEDVDADDTPEDGEDGGETTGKPSGGISNFNQTEASGLDGDGYNDRTNESADQKDSIENSQNAPNPMKNPGDASRFWHRRLNIVESADPEEDSSFEAKDTNEKSGEDIAKGDFQFSSGPPDSTQVLAEATQEEAAELESPNAEHPEQDPDVLPNASREKNENDKKNPVKNKSDRAPSKRENNVMGNEEDRFSSAEDEQLDSKQSENDMELEEIESNGTGDEGDDDGLVRGTRVVSDLSKLRVEQKDEVLYNEPIHEIEQDELFAQSSLDEVNVARSKWRVIQGDTMSLSRRLCEKVRLVMEPLVATKLRGDYRTGKRINMKRVIGYIASGYRKDKIWLRRTKPAKRDYRVLLAVDDSESMKKSGAGEMALRAMATVAVGMNQLEIGELGVASFGDDMKLVHPFHMPFTSDSGADVVRNFKFDQQRTRIALCVESAMAALEEAGDRSSMQLVFVISDGRIERDSRSALRRLIREMTERNILLAMIIVEGNQKKRDSILNMKEVTFEKGKPIVKRFIEDYPFPYYIVLDDVATLPEVLGDALKQWFEMLTQLQVTG
ncbi:cobaltochelatase [Nitzschia inconspicua]|uniref:Midasin n=1 Tax=Nitzschia inconspicua TaxID=303405 RepID=A0A9K3PEC7_9STRA|nr:cobaltochelatase [Nitzschia inconspicua]